MSVKRADILRTYLSSTYLLEEATLIMKYLEFSL